MCVFVCAGLVALRSEEVMEVMMEDYPSKYVEYREVVQERHFQATLHTKIMEARRVAVMVRVCSVYCLHTCRSLYIDSICIYRMSLRGKVCTYTSNVLLN